MAGQRSFAAMRPFARSERPDPASAVYYERVVVEDVGEELVASDKVAETGEFPPVAHLSSNWRRIVPYAMLTVGAMLLVATAAYYAYAYWAKSDLDSLQVVMERPSPLGERSPGTPLLAPARPLSSLDAQEQGATASEASSNASVVFEPIAPPVSDVTQTQVSTAESRDYEGAASQVSPDTNGTLGSAAADVVPRRSAAPAAVERNSEADVGPAAPSVVAAPDPPSQTEVAAPLSGISVSREPPAAETREAADLLKLAVAGRLNQTVSFAPALPELLPDKALAATRISIPAIGVDSVVSELRLLTKRDRLVWESPKWVVGHVPTSGRPGTGREGWYFGHLQSPVRREGNVFQKLPEIPPLLEVGETVHIIVETGNRKYLYQVYKTDWIDQDDLQITNSGEQDITLVTCYPTFVYDHRLLVTAALVGVTES